MKIYPTGNQPSRSRWTILPTHTSIFLTRRTQPNVLKASGRVHTNSRRSASLDTLRRTFHGLCSAIRFVFAIAHAHEYATPHRDLIYGAAVGTPTAIAMSDCAYTAKRGNSQRQDALRNRGCGTNR